MELLTNLSPTIKANTIQIAVISFFVESYWIWCAMCVFVMVVVVFSFLKKIAETYMNHMTTSEKAVKRHKFKSNLESVYIYQLIVCILNFRFIRINVLWHFHLSFVWVWVWVCVNRTVCLCWFFFCFVRKITVQSLVIPINVQMKRCANSTFFRNKWKRRRKNMVNEMKWKTH